MTKLPIDSFCQEKTKPACQFVNSESPYLGDFTPPAPGLQSLNIHLPILTFLFDILEGCLHVFGVVNLFFLFASAFYQSTSADISCPANHFFDLLGIAEFQHQRY
jgi:hypothetical protein